VVWLEKHPLMQSLLLLAGVLDIAAVQIDFWVWDAGRPVLNATVTRILLIDAPCPDKSAPYLCYNEYAGSSLCSGVYISGIDAACVRCLQMLLSRAVCAVSVALVDLPPTVGGRDAANNSGLIRLHHRIPL
jgi:hypothetical protein